MFDRFEETQRESAGAISNVGSILWVRCFVSGVMGVWLGCRDQPDSFSVMRSNLSLAACRLSESLPGSVRTRVLQLKHNTSVTRIWGPSSPAKHSRFIPLKGVPSARISAIVIPDKAIPGRVARPAQP